MHFSSTVGMSCLLVISRFALRRAYLFTQNRIKHMLDAVLFLSGNNRTRTYDILLVRQALSQLSYAPMATQKGLEPTTSSVTG